MCVCVCVCVYIYIYIYDSMKMYRNEKTKGLLKMILFVEIFANIKHSSGRVSY